MRVMSDLHLEHQEFQVPSLEGDDVLVLAGDIAPFKPRVQYRRFFNEVIDKFRLVVYVAGNHEYYGGHMSNSLNKFRDAFPDICVLDNESHVDGDRVFIGATLWTDLSDPMDSLRVGMGMNDYKVIRHEGYSRLTTERTTGEHYASRRYIAEEATKHPGKEVVVVTHHAPSELSVPKHFAGDSLNPGYVTAMDQEVFESGASLWIHGHVHTRHDYMIGGTRVVANPRGYPGENNLWNPLFEV